MLQCWQTCTINTANLQMHCGSARSESKIGFFLNGWLWLESICVRGGRPKFEEVAVG
eukprot:jgi/Botrbrau1/11639/Bobra.0209s0029.1